MEFLLSLTVAQNINRFALSLELSGENYDTATSDVEIEVKR